MAERTASASLRQFLSDLVAIRERGGYTLEDIFLVTKVNPYLIEQFESGGLGNHPLFNELYLRAFVRSYATAVDIPEEVMLDAYEQAVQGGYHRELAVRYLGLSRGEIAVEESYTEKVRAEKPVTKQAEPSRDEAEEATSQTEEAEDEPVLEPVRAASTESQFQYVPATDNPVASEGGAADEGQDLGSKITEWIQSLSTRLQDLTGQQAIMQWAAIGGGLVVVALVVFGIFRMTGSSPTEVANADVNVPTPVAADSVLPPDPADENVDEPEVEEVQPPPPPQPQVEARPQLQPLQMLRAQSAADPNRSVVLGDSIALYVVAVTGNIAPFRAKVDADLRRPYWLDQGDSIAFYLQNQIILQDQLDSVAVSIAGYTYPLEYADTLGRAVITRASIRAFLADFVQVEN